MTRKRKDKQRPKKLTEFFLWPSRGGGKDGTGASAPAASSRPNGHYTDLSDEPSTAEKSPMAASPHSNSPSASSPCASPSKVRMRLDCDPTSSLVSHGENPSLSHSTLHSLLPHSSLYPTKVFTYLMTYLCSLWILKDN